MDKKRPSIFKLDLFDLNYISPDRRTKMKKSIETSIARANGMNRELLNNLKRTVKQKARVLN